MNGLFLLPIFVVSVFILILIILTMYTLKLEANRKKKISNEGGLTAEEERNQLLHQASLKAHDLLNEAELTGIKRIAEHELSARRIEEVFSHEIKKLVENSIQEITRSTKELERTHQQYITESEEIIKHHLDENKKTIEHKIQEVIERNEAYLESYYEELKKKLDLSMDTELKQVKEQIKGYQQNKIDLINEELTQIVEEITGIVLKKGFTHKDHIDLIQEAFEDAHKAGFFNK